MKIEATMSGGDPRSIKGVDKVVKFVLKNPSKLSELFDCINSSEETVRMRASDALEKICKQKPDWFIKYKDQLLNDWPKIKQASVQWHLAQILGEINLNEDETKQAINILLNHFKITNDWIVINLTLESLASFVRKGSFTKEKFVELLYSQRSSSHKSVVSRVNRLLKEFSKVPS
jgi:hypothetical protein